ncbi:MAG: hypothetical protein MUF01_15255 [Bryobacterales bacterium]|nr:hypothetical protein [Bryobacterales bacterium]
MKQVFVLFAAVFAAFFCSPALAQTDVLVAPVELSSGFAAVPGRVVLAGSQVLFWSDSAQYPSFYVPKASVRRAAISAGVLTVELTEPIAVQDGTRSRFEMRLTSDADAAAMENWFNRPANTVAGLRTAAMPGSGPAATDSKYSYLVEHRKRFGRNSSGKILFRPDAVVWESLDDATDSRTFPYKTIQRFDRKNPYELVVDTFNEGKYTFRFTGSPLGDADFKAITDMLTAGRADARQ